MNICFFLAMVLLMVNIIFIKKRRLSFGYSFLWTTICIIIFILSFNKGISKYFSEPGQTIHVPGYILFIAASAVIFMFFHLTVVASDMKRRITRLTQENALLSDKINETLNKEEIHV